MTKAVLICPGRGTYNTAELGTLARHFPDANLMSVFDKKRRELGQETLSDLDGAERFSNAKHTRGDNASALIYTASYGDQLSLRDDIDVVAVTGNSMGWYSALACAGAVSPEAGFEIVNTMGSLMQAALIGGQLVYPFVGDDWTYDESRRSQLLTLVSEIDGQNNSQLALSIDLGGMLVLAGNEQGLNDFEKSVPQLDRFPLRLPNHAAFHSALMTPISADGKSQLPVELFQQPTTPMIDGRGAIWWPHASNLFDLWDYTLGHQVTETYDFTRAITVAAREFAPDLFIVAGPGTTLGGAVVQSLISANWRGMANKSDFQTLQAERPFLISMGREDQRSIVA